MTDLFSGSGASAVSTFVPAAQKTAHVFLRRVDQLDDAVLFPRRFDCQLLEDAQRQRRSPRQQRKCQALFLDTFYDIHAEFSSFPKIDVSFAKVPVHFTIFFCSLPEAALRGNIY